MGGGETSERNSEGLSKTQNVLWALTRVKPVIIIIIIKKEWMLLEKEMATHSSILAWKIPWTEEPGKLQFMGSQRFGDDRATSLLSLYILYQEQTRFISIILL